jgi:hypothetical protein
VKKFIDKRLYRGMSRRQAKKHLGDCRKLNFGVNLKPGDLVSSCKGYNERIKEITPVWTGHLGRSYSPLPKGRIICDFDIITESGHSCSLIHCCTVPTETREQINQFWRECAERQPGHDELHYTDDSYPKRVVKLLDEGGQAFDEDGQPHYEFCNEWERKERFPERWAKEHPDG